MTVSPGCIRSTAWARRLSGSEVGELFGTNWNRVYDAVKWAVSYGLAHRDLDGITVIGVDELGYRKGRKSMTVAHEIDADHRRLPWIGWDRTFYRAGVRGSLKTTAKRAWRNLETQGSE